jgi:hypothetical protein
MKLLVVTCLKEYLPDVSAIFEKAAIQVFSMSEVIGRKDVQARSLVDNWFSSGTGEYDSLMIFSFTEDGNAEKAMALINNYNKTVSNEFPIRAFIVPVENFNDKQ